MRSKRTKRRYEVSDDDIALSEKRMYGEKRPETHAYVASGWASPASKRPAADRAIQPERTVQCP